MVPFSIAASVAPAVTIVVAFVAVPGLFGRVRGPEEKPWVRLMAAVVLAVVVGAAWDLHRSEKHRVPVPLAVVATGGPVLEGVAVHTYSRAGDAQAVAESLLAAGVARPADDAPVALVWTANPELDKVAGDDLTGLPEAALVAGATLWSGRAMLPFDPATAVRVELARALVVGRPNAFRVYLDLPAAMRDAGPSVVVSVLGRDDARFEFRADGEEAWTPTLPAGDVEVAVELAFESLPHVVRARVSVRIADRQALAGAVLVAGRRDGTGTDADNLVGALTAQGIAARAVTAGDLAASLESLTPVPAVLALGRLEEPDQRALARYVDDGGGLFLAGGADGGALPWPDEPLHRLLPVVCPPRVAADGGGAGAVADRETDDPSAGDGGDSPEQTSPEPEPAEEDRPPPVKPDPDKEPDERTRNRTETPSGDAPAAQGDVADAPDAVSPRAENAAPVRRRRVAMALVIDRSGSMDAPVGLLGTRMDFAKRAGFETGRSLDPVDRLGVVTFATHAAVVRPIQPLGFDVDASLEVIRRIAVGIGATNMDRGVQSAVAMLDRDDSPVRHIVVVTDGILSVPVQTLTEAVVAGARSRGITVSVVHIRDSDTGTDTVAPGMRRIAELRGGGRYRATRDPTKVPALVLGEVLRVAGRGPSDGGSGDLAESEGAADSGDEAAGGEEPEDPLAVDEPAQPEQANSPADSPPADVEAMPPPEVAGDPEQAPIPVRAVASSPLLDAEGELGDGYPPLLGLVGVRARWMGRVLLATEPQGLPVLAFGHHGLGRIGVWTADLAGEQARAWREHPAFPAWLAQWVSFVSRGTAPEDVDDPFALDLTRPTVEPAAPTPRMVSALSRLARPAGVAGTPGTLSQLKPPAPRETLRGIPLLPLVAWIAFGCIVLFAAVERLVRGSV